MMTLFEYLYRDAGNYKAFGSLALDGALTEAEMERVGALLDNDGFFVAEQIGVPALYQQLYQWSGGPTADDHCWHQFLSIKVVEEAEVPADAHRWGSARHFLDTLTSVRTWEEERSPHSGSMRSPPPPALYETVYSII